MNDLQDIYTKYKPYQITKKGKVIILKTMTGNYAVKFDNKIDYKKLYNYLYTRSFNYVPEIVELNDNYIIFKYEDDVILDDNQKALDMAELVSLLHTKTCYFKDITNDKCKEIYDNLKNNIEFMNNYYNECFDLFVVNRYMRPSEYLFLRNYSLIKRAIDYARDRLDYWYSLVEGKNKQRVCLTHANLELDHFLKNDNNYLISWDNYIVDSPVLDLYKLYQKDWERISFGSFLDKYNDNFKLLEEERLLFDIMISIPYKIEFNEREIDNCRNMRKLLSYLGKSGHIVNKATEV